MIKHLTRAELRAGLPHILDSPKDNGVLEAIVIRPEPGERLQIGTAVIEITTVAHTGCKSFVERYGSPAVVFVNGPEGRAKHLRSIYARVVQDGCITVSDRVVKTN